jgi:hypothetical protein
MSTAVAEVSTGSVPATGVEVNNLPGYDPRDPSMVFLAQLDQRWRLANMLVKSGLIPQKTPEAALAVMMKSHEMGIQPMQGFANIYFFDGKLGISADLMTALFIQRVGGRIEVEEWTNTTCRARFSRPGWEPSVVEYTFEDATKAGLTGKPNWKNVKAMLSARCRAMGVRMVAPDVFAATLTREELEDMAEARYASLGSRAATGTGPLARRPLPPRRGCSRRPVPVAPRRWRPKRRRRSPAGPGKVKSRIWKPLG